MDKQVEIAAAQNRPYILFIPSKISVPKWVEEEGIPNVVYSIRNFGSTPAIIIATDFGDVGWRTLPDKPNYVHHIPVFVTIEKDEVVGQTFAIMSEDTAAGRIPWIPSKRTDAYFFGCVTYADVSGKIRKSGFGWKFEHYLGNCTLAGGSVFNYDREEGEAQSIAKILHERS